MVPVDRQAVEQIAQSHTDEQRDERAAQCHAPLPGRAPSGVVDLAPVLERHPPRHEGQQDDEQRQVEGGEHRAVPEGEGCEGGGTGDDEPHLVAVPGRADGVDRHPALGVVPGHERV